MTALENHVKKDDVDDKHTIVYKGTDRIQVRSNL